jgi:RNA polymerase sigma factor (sigma-70 family)
MSGPRRRAGVSTLAREEIWAEVARHRGLCGAIAREYAGRGLDREDLVQEGLLGLYRAFELFDPSKGAEFVPYAVDWIRAVMRQALLDQGQTVRSPAYARKLATRYAQGRIDLTRLKPSRRSCILAAVATVGTVGGLDGDSDAQELSLPAEDPADRERLDDARAAIERLDRRARFVLARRFGLDGDRPRTRRQVADALGLTRERVRQIERRALAKLRELIDA